MTPNSGNIGLSGNTIRHKAPSTLRVTANIFASTQCTLDWWAGGLPYDRCRERMQERRAMCRKRETKELVVYAWPLQPVCFRSVLKDYPFISPYILVSVVTQREAS